nr:unnamed protein product [Callosobruchus analis]
MSYIFFAKKAFNLKFVEEVEKHPELYNYTLHEYSKRDATEKAWSNVAKEVNLSVNECKERWRNLRSTFVKKLKPKPSGSGASKKPYYLMEAMQFAIPFVKVAGNPTGNLDDIPPTVSPCPTSTKNIEEIPNTQEGDEDLTEDLLDQPGPSPRGPSSPIITRPSISARQGDRSRTPLLPVSAGARGPHGLPIRKRKYLQGDEAERAFSEYVSAKKEKLSTLHPPTDERDKREEGIKNFVLSLIPDQNDVQLSI